MAQISEELDGLSVALIQTAIDMLDAGDAVPVMLATDADAHADADGGTDASSAQRALLTFEDDSPDGCYRAAREHVAALGDSCSRYVLLYDGIVQEDEADPGQPALLFEFGERGMENAWSGYVLYRLADDGMGYEVSDPLPAGAEDLLFS